MKLLSVIFFLTLLAGFTGCEINSETEDPAEYLFVEHHIHKHGILLSGPVPPLLMIDFPTYSFDADSGKLTGIINFGIDDNLKIIFGSGSCLSGTAGGGCGTGLSGINTIPFKRENFEILKMDEKGKIIFEYNNKVHLLNAGEELKTEVTYNDTVIVDKIKSISKITVTDRITNFGFLDQSKIRKWEW